ncbi:MAG: hypothetical protein LC620_01530, partial [Halobacteriales archaeon]|nr:hypothetical protein [Halobacteriales archaeon]
MLWAEALQVVSVAVLVALALLLLSADSASRASRAFAILLFFRGLVLGTQFLANGHDLGLGSVFWWRILPFLIFPLTFLPLYFLTAYHGGRRAKRHWAWWTAGAILACSAAYLLDPKLFWDLPAAMAAGADPTQSPLGPLFALNDLFLVPYAVVAWWLARRDSRRPAQGSANLLVSLGFAVQVLFNDLVFLAIDRSPFQRPPFLVAATVFSVAVSLLFVAAAAWEVARLPALQRPWGPRTPRRYMAVLALAAVSALALFIPSEAPAAAMADSLAALWRLVLPVLVSYALLRNRLFNIELQAKVTLRASIVAGMTGALFFLIEASLQSSFPTRDLESNLAAALVVAVALYPLNIFARRLLDRLMPNV